MQDDNRGLQLIRSELGNGESQRSANAGLLVAVSIAIGVGPTKVGLSRRAELDGIGRLLRRGRVLIGTSLLLAWLDSEKHAHLRDRLDGHLNPSQLSSVIRLCFRMFLPARAGYAN